MGAIYDLVPAIQKVFIWLVSSLLMNIFSIVLFLIIEDYDQEKTEEGLP